MLLELQNLGKSFGEHEVLKDVNAGVERGDRIGIIGANGTGKTTLLRILCGESLPDAGDAAFGTGVTCGYLEQNARLAPTLDIYATMKLAFAPALDAMQKMDDLQRRLAADPHNATLTEEIAHCTAIVDAMDAYNMDTQIKKVLNGMGFPADTWVKLAGVLSGGEQTRLRLARLLLERPDLLILDEPTNHLDLETMEWLENYLKTYRGAVLVVSHDRYFLDAVCTRIWELRGKTIKTYRGNYSAYLPQREAADERQQKLHDAAVEKAAKLQDYVDRNLVRASTTKMAQSRRKQLEKLEIVEAPTAEAYELNFRFEYDIEPYDELVIMKNLTVRRYGSLRQRRQAWCLHPAAGQARRQGHRCHLEPVPPLYRTGSPQPPGPLRLPGRGSVQGLRRPLRRRTGPPAICRAGPRATQPDVPGRAYQPPGHLYARKPDPGVGGLHRHAAAGHS